MLNHPRAGSGYGRPTGGGRSCEYAYEALGAVVYDQRESWYLIEFIRDSTRLLGWVSERHSGAFHSLEHLLRDGLAFLTAAWDQRLYATPRAFLTTSPPAEPTGTNGTSTSNRPACQGASSGWRWRFWDPATAPPASDHGSLRVAGFLHASTGQPNAWFYSRGC